MITVDQAYEMGAKGADPTETERQLFEAWMSGHCWMLHGDWDGKTYVHEAEKTGYLHPGAMLTRQLWAAWRDRAALAEQPAQPPENLWLYWRVDNKSAVTGPFKTSSKDEAYSIDCIDQMALAAPQPAQPSKPWVGLTDEEREIASWAAGSFGDGARWAEAKLQEKNT